MKEEEQLHDEHEQEHDELETLSLVDSHCHALRRPAPDSSSGTSSSVEDAFLEAPSNLRLVSFAVDEADWPALLALRAHR